MTGRIVVLTGERGVGKSTVCHKTVALAQARQYTCCGILTMSYPDGNRDVLDVQSGAVRRLTLEPEATSGVAQGRFRFDPAALAWGDDVLSQILACDLLVVDELGPLEIERGAGWPKAFDVLKEANFKLGLVVVRPELLVQAQLKLPTSATVVFTVTPKNRDGLPEVLGGMIQK
jgi:nucleoside-triphosphatase THEP1